MLDSFMVRAKDIQFPCPEGHSSQSFLSLGRNQTQDSSTLTKGNKKTSASAVVCYLKMVDLLPQFGDKS